MSGARNRVASRARLAGRRAAPRKLAGYAGALLAVAMCGAMPSSAETAALRISKAWIPATGQTGGDVPLLMTITNDGPADSLLRVACPFANFSERHVIDRGEGAPAMRSIRMIPIAAETTTELKADGYHVMLLQIRQKLAVGDKLTCSVTFQKAGPMETEVEVRNPSQ